MVILLSAWVRAMTWKLPGLNQRSRGLPFSCCCHFSMAGVPPTVGFYAKLLVIGGDRRRFPLAGGCRGAVLGDWAFYYLRVVKLMYFDKPTDSAPFQAGADMRAR
jgi:NADH-quinone oxidoreductase subunit N